MLPSSLCWRSGSPKMHQQLQQPSQAPALVTSRLCRRCSKRRQLWVSCGRPTCSSCSYGTQRQQLMCRSWRVFMGSCSSWWGSAWSRNNQRSLRWVVLWLGSRCCQHSMLHASCACCWGDFFGRHWHCVKQMQQPAGVVLLRPAPHMQRRQQLSCATSWVSMQAEQPRPLGCSQAETQPARYSAAQAAGPAKLQLAVSAGASTNTVHDHAAAVGGDSRVCRHTGSTQRRLCGRPSGVAA